MRDVILDEKMIFDEDIEVTKLNFDQLAELLQQLNETETTKQSESDRLNLDNNNIVMPESDNTDLNDHDSHNSDENQL